MALEQVVVGWARGGLGYVTKLLESSGAEVGTTFGPDTSWENLEERLKAAKPVEVSPFLVPFLSHEGLKAKPTTFVVRDPMRVLNSMYFHGLFHCERPSTVAAFAFQHLPRFKAKFHGMPAQAGCSYLHNWHRTANRSHSNLQRVRVEEGPVRIRKHFGLPPSGAYVEPYVNASYCKQSLVPSVLPQKSRDGIVGLLFNFGYREAYWSPRGGHAHYVNPDWHC